MPAFLGARRALVARTGGIFTPVNAETAAYLAACAVKPSTARTLAIDAAYTRFKSRTWWAKTDWFSTPAAHDEQAARINWRNPAQVATTANLGNGPFTVDQGYVTPSGTSPAMTYNTGVNPATAGGSFSLNSAHLSVWIYRTPAGAAVPEVDQASAQIWSSLSGTWYVRANTSGLITVPGAAPTPIGHRAWSRTAANAVALYQDGNNVLNGTTASTGITSTNLIMNSARPVAILAFGGGLSDAEMAQQRADMAAWLDDAAIIPAFDVFLVIGDSNNHYASGSDAAIDVPSPNVWAVSSDFTAMYPSVNPNYFYTGDATHISYTVAFLRDFYTPATGRKALILQTSAGGSGLFASSNYWQSPSGAGYVASVKAMNIALAAFPNATFRGILSILGANDATSSTAASSEQAALDAMITALRTNITGATNVPFVIGGIPPNYLSTGTAAAIQTMLSQIGTRVAHSAYADPSSPTVLNHTGDPIHYDAQDARGTLGAPGGMAGRFWTAWQALT